VARVFWRAETPWVLVRGDHGQVFATPWAATDLPTPVDVADGEAPLLSPAALRALTRFVCEHRAIQAGGKSGG